MYRRPKFLEILLEIRQEMALEADYDVDLFAEIARSGNRPPAVKGRPSVIHDMSASKKPTVVSKPPATRSKTVHK